MNNCGIFFRISLCKTTKKIFPLLLIIFLHQASSQVFAQVQSEVVITNKYANIRQGPAISYKLVGKAYQDERFPYIETRNGWYRIMFNDQIAWVYGKLARIDRVNTQEVESLKRDIEILDNRVGQVMNKLETAISELEQKREQERMEVMLEKPVPAYMAIIPGGHRFAHGDNIHGAALLGVTAASLGLGLYYHGDYNDKLESYNNLDYGSSAEEFDRLYDEAEKSLKLSDAFFYTAAGAFAFNIVDYLFLRHSQLKEIRVMQEKYSGPAGSGSRINLSLVKEF